MIINKSMFKVPSSFGTMTQMRNQMDVLQKQLATQQRASTLSELGNDTSYDLVLRQRMGRVEAYQRNITTVDMRLEFMNNSIERLDELESEARATATAGEGAHGTGIATARALASSRLDEVITLLNTDLNGRYLFGGSTTDAPPVKGMKALLDGAGGADGFRAVAGERKLADLGANGMGRLATGTPALTAAMAASDTVSVTEANAAAHPNRPQITSATTSNAAEITISGPTGTPNSASVQFSGAVGTGDTVSLDLTLADGSTVTRTFTAVAGTPANGQEFQIGATGDDTATSFKAALDATLQSDTVTLSEDGAHVFGMKLSSLSSSSSGIALGSPGGTAPQSLSLRVAAQPLAGESVTIGLTLPDGRAHSLVLTATEADPAGKGQFTIGADIEATTANLKSSLDAELVRVGQTALAASSVYAAADNFFAGKGETAMRVDGPPFESATGLKVATATDTMLWYQGEDSTGRARDSVSAQVDEATTVSYGAQANESGITALVRSLAAMAIETYPSGDPNASERFNSMNRGQLERLSEAHNSDEGSLEVMMLELGVAKATNGQAGERHIGYMGQLETMLSDLETVPIEEVAMKLVSLQTRLEAAYQTTAVISQLTLVNYLP